jgi:hypothetical protein
VEWNRACSDEKLTRTKVREPWLGINYRATTPAWMKLVPSLRSLPPPHAGEAAGC